MKKIVSLFLIAVLVFSILPLSVFAEGEIASISYKTEHTKFVENTDGEWDEHDNYFRYRCNFHEGDELTVNYTVGEPTVYVAQFIEGELYFTSQGKTPIKQWYDIYTFNNQQDEHWMLNGNYQYGIYYKGHTTLVDITIVKNPISSIVYTPFGEKTVYENSGGEWRTDEGGNKFYDYHIGFSLGDTLSVTYSDNDETVDYTFKNIDNEQGRIDYFFDDQDNILPGTFEDLYTYTRGDWYAQSPNSTIVVGYKGNEAEPVYVQILKNPVTSVEYLRKSPLEYYEGDTYHDQDGNDYYHNPNFEDGDSLVVSYSDESVGTVTYIYSHETESFVSGDRKISRDEVDIHSEQHNKPWSLGSENEYYVEYMGYRLTLYATVSKNPIESIEYIPIEITEYLEGTMMYYDEWAKKDFYERPNVQEGDKLIVNYADPQQGRVEYTAKFDQSTDMTTFVSDADDSDIIVVDDKFEFRDDQDNNPWQEGENYYSVFYCGKEAKVPVIIEKNTITGIAYKPLNTPQVWETDFAMDTDAESGEQYKHYNLPDFEDGDILTVYYSDKEPKDFVLTSDESDGEHYFVNGDKKYHQYTLFRFDRQNENEWSKEADNYYYIDFYGFITGIKVRIIDTDVESISFKSLNDLILEENKNGEYLYDDQGQKFFFYNQVQIVTPGDSLTVTYNDERGVVEYFLIDDTENKRWLLRSAGGDEIDTNEVDIDDHQWENHWVAGINYFDIIYHGVRTTVPVTIKKSYIPGDIDGNSVANNLDLILLFQYLSGWDVEVNEAATDINGDGQKNNLDLIILFQYLSGWDVQIH